MQADPESDSADELLVAAFGRGDDRATQTVRGWVERVVRFENWRFRDPEAAVQETTLRVYRTVRAGRFKGASKFRTFVHSVATHSCIDLYRKERRRSKREVSEEAAVDPPTVDPQGESLLAEQEGRQALSYIFQKLSAACRELWQWVYFEQRPAAEIAETLSISEGNVRVRVHRCLERARKIATELVECGEPLRRRSGRA